MKKRSIIGVVLLIAVAIPGFACTGISLKSKDGSSIQARTIEWANGILESSYVIIPRGEKMFSYTPDGKEGLTFTAKYGTVGLTVATNVFIAEGMNEKGLSAGLFYFPGYGKYEDYNPKYQEKSLIDLQFVNWVLTQFATIDEVKEALNDIKVVGLNPEGMTSTVHWRIAERGGRVVVLEFIDGVPHFYENKVGVLTNSPDFNWHLTNLNNYVNLHPGAAPNNSLGSMKLSPISGNSGFLGLPGDATSPSRFVRAAFYRNTAPKLDSAFETVAQAFHILNNFDIPMGIQHPAGKVPDFPSATQWTCVSDQTNLIIYYKTAENSLIRSIDLNEIDFGRINYQNHPLDKVKKEHVERIYIEYN